MSLVGLAAADEPTTAAGDRGGRHHPVLPGPAERVPRSEVRVDRRPAADLGQGDRLGADEERPVILITTDSLGRLRRDRPGGRGPAQAEGGIDPARVSITATHTHSAPMLNGVAPNIFGEPIPDDAQFGIDRYTTSSRTISKRSRSRRRLKDRRPARGCRGASGRPLFAINRRARGGSRPGRPRRSDAGPPRPRRGRCGESTSTTPATASLSDP